MALSIRYSEEKNQLLKVTRRLSFEEVRDAIERGKLLADISHPSRKYPHQRLYVVEINHYACAVPYVINREKKEVFLKTAYRSRVLTKYYLRGGKDDKQIK
jgi:hypothetical protein